jgi:hypothetical protein
VAEMLPEFVRKKNSAEMVWCSDCEFLVMIASLQQVVKGKSTNNCFIFQFLEIE